MARRRQQRQSTEWRNRIIGHGTEDPEQLLANPKNYRIHPRFQQDVVESSLNQIGWIDEITVNQRTGCVVDGHLRASLAISRGEKKVPTRYVDLSEEEEAAALGIKDPSAALAVHDDEKLNELIAGIQTDEAALLQLFDQLQSDSAQTVLRDVDETSTERNLGDKSAQIKPVLYAEDISTFEEAIRLTGERNRGKAVIEICRAYIQQKERQFDFPAQGATPN